MLHAMALVSLANAAEPASVNADMRGCAKGLGLFNPALVVRQRIGEGESFSEPGKLIQYLRPSVRAFNGFGVSHSFALKGGKLCLGPYLAVDSISFGEAPEFHLNAGGTVTFALGGGLTFGVGVRWDVYGFQPNTLPRFDGDDVRHVGLVSAAVTNEWGRLGESVALTLQIGANLPSLRHTLRDAKLLPAARAKGEELADKLKEVYAEMRRLEEEKRQLEEKYSEDSDRAPFPTSPAP